MEKHVDLNTGKPAAIHFNGSYGVSFSLVNDGLDALRPFNIHMYEKQAKTQPTVFASEVAAIPGGAQQIITLPIRPNSTLRCGDRLTFVLQIIFSDQVKGQFQASAVYQTQIIPLTIN